MRVIGDLLKRTAEIYPDKIGIIDKLGKYVAVDTQYTWKEINEKVNRLVNSLLKLGLKSQDRVAIYSDTRAQFFIIYQALAKAGLVTVPINTAYKGEELLYLIKNSDARAIFVDGDKTQIIEALKAQLQQINYFIEIGKGNNFAYQFEELIENGSKEEPVVKVAEEDLVLLLYTSGTTGRPKGAMMTHRNWCTSAYIVTGEWRLYPHHKFLCVLAPYFTGGLAYMTFAAARGFTLVLSPFEPQRVLDIIEKEKIDYSMLIPTMTSRLVKYPDVHKYDLSSLKSVITSGAPISEALVKEACDKLFNGEMRIRFTYGTSETAISGCQLQPEEVSLEEDKVHRLSSVGKPMLGIDLKIIDEEGKELKPGSKEAGEIVISGDTVGKGYLGMPENEELKDGVWFSGDLATMDEDGYIYIVDRKKDMILSGGANVFPREVEDVLYAFPSVIHAAVIGVPDKDWGERVHAVIVLNEGADVSVEQIINFCKQRLASYKCPKTVEFVDAKDLPISSVGKILKRELKKKYWEGYERKGIV